MTAPLYLSRARVRTHAPVAALRELLLPRDDGKRAGAGHRLIWTLFADDPARDRDFLWRETEGGTFYVLSHRPPRDVHSLFDLDEPKVFAPSLSAGDHLRFSLRANATVAKGGGPNVRGKPCDVVMAAIRDVTPGARAPARTEAVDNAGRRWLGAQGARCGFALTTGDPPSALPLHVTSYRTLRVEHAGPSARIGVLDFEGVLEVTDPELFVASVGRGFGRAKAFGCGLMLVRRA